MSHGYISFGIPNGQFTADNKINSIEAQSNLNVVGYLQLFTTSLGSSTVKFGSGNIVDFAGTDLAISLAISGNTISKAATLQSNGSFSFNLTSADINALGGGTPTVTITPDYTKAANWSNITGGNAIVGASNTTIQTAQINPLNLNSSAFYVLLGGTSLTQGNATVGTSSNLFRASETSPSTVLPTFSIDLISPSVTNVTATTANGTYGLGSTITLTVVFSEAVNISGGTPQLELESGSHPHKLANYISGSGTNTLVFQYVVQGGDNSSDLDYASNTSLFLNGSTIKDLAGNIANTTLPDPGAVGSLGANRNIIIQTYDADASVLPGPLSEPVTLPYSADSLQTAVSVFDFNLIDGGTSDNLALAASQAVIHVSGSGDPSKVVWLLNGPDATDKVGVYDSGNKTITFSGLNISVANGQSETYSVKGYYNGAVTDTTGIESGKTFILSIDGDTDITLGASSTKMGATAPVDNGTGTTIVDDVAPVITGVTSPSANKTYFMGETVNISVSFNESVLVTGNPQLALGLPRAGSAARYVSGNGTNTLVFSYTVDLGDVTSDLEYASTNALGLNQGTITDAAGNNALLNLPALNDQGSLAFGKNIQLQGAAFFSYKLLSQMEALRTGTASSYQPSLVGGLEVGLIFDESQYLNQYTDVANAIRAGVFKSGYQHFVNFGLKEGRNPSVLFDEQYYLSTNSDVANAVQSKGFQSGLQHFLSHGHKEGRNPSQLFSQSDYLLNNSDVNTAVQQGAFGSAFEHFIKHGVMEQRLPTFGIFNEEYYLSQYQDVAAAISSGAFKSGFEHFIKFGQKEGRSPSTIFNEGNYLGANSDVNGAVTAGSYYTGFEHFAKFGHGENREVFA